LDNTTYKPGDVANGHRLGDDGQWVPVEEAAPVEATAYKVGFKLGKSVVVVLGLLAVLLVGIGIGAAAGGTPEARTATVTKTVEVPAEITQAEKDALIKQGHDQAVAEATAKAAEEQAAAAAAAPPAGQVKPGQYIVGDDIQPGRYRGLTEVTGLCYADTQHNGNIGEQEVVTTGKLILDVPNQPGTVVTIEDECGTVEKVG
jgi:hypothetical protein